MTCPHTTRIDERERPCSQCLIPPRSRKVQRVKPPRIEIKTIEIPEPDESDEVPTVQPRDESPTRPLGTTPERAIQEFLAAVDGGYRVASPTGPRPQCSSEAE